MQRKSYIYLIVILSIIAILILPGGVKANSVEYRGEAEGLITTKDDFFSEFRRFNAWR